MQVTKVRGGLGSFAFGQTILDAYRLISVLYNAGVKSWDAIIVGAGIIGISLAIDLRKRNMSVLIVERGEPGREASHAAGGMLADCVFETLVALEELTSASARMYPEFAYELEVESGMRVDLRDQGTLISLSDEHVRGLQSSTPVRPANLSEMEPALANSRAAFYHIKERSVDPRALTAAAIQTAKRRGVDFSSGDEVTSVNVSDGRVTGVSTKKTTFQSPIVVDCAGAWSGQIGPNRFPTRPVKGQMLCLISPVRDLLKHVVRAPEIYLIPRSDGRIIVGSTIEEAGFDKRTDVDTIQRLWHAATDLVPELRNAKVLEDWAGLRPGTPDALPILGATTTLGYYVATGHFRDGILLAPVTAQVMGRLIDGKEPDYNLSLFSPERF